MNANNKLYDVSAELDNIFGAPGTESRREAEDLAWQEYNAQILLDARKNAGLTQEALAERIGASKGYIHALSVEKPHLRYLRSIVSLQQWD